MQVPLSHWLRLLWGISPRLAFDSDCAHIAGGSIHLPAQQGWRQHQAAAAHAAAHLVYSPQRFDGAGLGPIARTLLALLEDARVEALAMRELPGLSRLWRPLHTATPDIGVGFEGLALRLARSLCDPAYDDPDPWVRKGRALCFLDRALSAPAVRTPAELREVATRLGHDIGQLRLPFNAKAALPLPAYRDDHRWMWAADALSAVSSPQPIIQAPAADTADESPANDAEAVHHPEWDRLIARLRSAWCRVVDVAAPGAAPVAIGDSARAAARRLLGPVREFARSPPRAGCSDTGESFDLDALVQWQLGHRARRPTEARVYRQPRETKAPTALWLLIDRSASTAAPAHAAHSGAGALEAAAQSALVLALALQSQGMAFGIAAFCSNGRHAVHWQVVKAFDQAADDAMLGRLLALRSEGSTRLGAALRHAARHLEVQRAAKRWVLLLSDGHPHDIDVHDPAYLVEDARHAVSTAARRGVRIGCLAFRSVVDDDDAAGMAARVFGARGAAEVNGIDALPAALWRLIA